MKILESSAYICSTCGEKVYPTIKNTDLDKEELTTEIETAEVRGGLGNRVIKDNICPKCIKEMKEGAELFTKMKMGGKYYV